MNFENSKTGKSFSSDLIHFALKTWIDVRMLYKLTLFKEENHVTLLHVNFIRRRIRVFSPFALFLKVSSFYLYHFSFTFKRICNYKFSKRTPVFQKYRNTFPSKGHAQFSWIFIFHQMYRLRELHRHLLCYYLVFNKLKGRKALKKGQIWAFSWSWGAGGLRGVLLSGIFLLLRNNPIVPKHEIKH